MRRVGFGVIGTGIVGGAWHAYVYGRLPQSKLVAVCDLNEQRANEAAKKYGASAVYTDYRKLLENPEIAAVSIATPDQAHREIAVAAAEAGKHILVEKPMATTVEDAEAIVKAAKKAKVKLMVDFHNRLSPPFANAKKSVQNGELGKLAYIYARLSNTTWVPREMLPWASKSSALWFLGSHITDLARWMLEDEPKRVYAVSRSGILKEMGVDAPDFHISIVEFKKGGVVTLENAWILPDAEPMVFNLKFHMLGSKGSFYINTSDHRAAQQFTKDSATLPDILGVTFSGDSPRMSGFVLEAIARFVDAVVDDQPVLADGQDGLVVTRVLAAIAESAKTGRPVDL